MTHPRKSIPSNRQPQPSPTSQYSRNQKPQLKEYENRTNNVQESTCPILMFRQVVRIKLSKCLKAFQSHLISPLQYSNFQRFVCCSVQFYIFWFELWTGLNSFPFLSPLYCWICGYVESWGINVATNENFHDQAIVYVLDWTYHLLEYCSYSSDNLSLHCIMSKPILCKCVFTALRVFIYLLDGTTEAIHFGKRSLTTH